MDVQHCQGRNNNIMVIFQVDVRYNDADLVSVFMDVQHCHSCHDNIIVIVQVDVRYNDADLVSVYVDVQHFHSCHDNIMVIFSSLMLGIMMPTWFLSMWMSNTAKSAIIILWLYSRLMLGIMMPTWFSVYVNVQYCHSCHDNIIVIVQVDVR